MKITALLDALNSALAEPFALAWVTTARAFACVHGGLCGSGYRGRDGSENTRPGAEHGSAAWGDVFRLNKFYMDKRGPNLLLTQHFHIGIDGYKHKHNTNILIVGGSGAGKRAPMACRMYWNVPALWYYRSKAEILRKTGNLLKQRAMRLSYSTS